MMQDMVGIVRKEDEMQKASKAWPSSGTAPPKPAPLGNREYNPGWHTALT